MAEVEPPYAEVTAPSPPLTVNSTGQESSDTQALAQRQNEETQPVPVIVQANSDVNSQQQVADVDATCNEACVGEDDEVQFIFSTPRRKKKKKRRLEISGYPQLFSPEPHFTNETQPRSMGAEESFQQSSASAAQQLTPFAPNNGGMNTFSRSGSLPVPSGHHSFPQNAQSFPFSDYDWESISPLQFPALGFPLPWWCQAIPDPEAHLLNFGWRPSQVEAEPARKRKCDEEDSDAEISIYDDHRRSKQISPRTTPQSAHTSPKIPPVTSWDGLNFAETSSSGFENKISIDHSLSSPKLQQNALSNLNKAQNLMSKPIKPNVISIGTIPHGIESPQATPSQSTMHKMLGIFKVNSASQTPQLNDHAGLHLRVGPVDQASPVGNSNQKTTSPVPSTPIPGPSISHSPRMSSNRQAFLPQNNNRDYSHERNSQRNCFPSQNQHSQDNISNGNHPQLVFSSREHPQAEKPPVSVSSVPATMTATSPSTSDILRKPSLYTIPAWSPPMPPSTQVPSIAQGLRPVYNGNKTTRIANSPLSDPQHRDAPCRQHRPLGRPPPESTLNANNGMIRASPSRSSPTAHPRPTPTEDNFQIPRARSGYKHSPNLIVDIAETCQDLFPFATIAERHGVPIRKVFDTFSAIIQLPLLRNAGDRRRHGSLGKMRMKEYRDARKAMERSQEAERKAQMRGMNDQGEEARRRKGDIGLLRTAVLNNVRENQGPGGRNT